jgi:hypothetical protein
MSSDPIRPTIRQDRAYELRQHLFDWISSYDAELVRTCLTCTLFNEKQELCNKWKSRPPARVIAYGCPDYFAEDEIPF